MKTSDSNQKATDTAQPMTTREAHDKALDYFGKNAAVEDMRDERFFNPNFPVGPCRIGFIRLGLFSVMAHGKTFEEAFQTDEATIQTQP